MANQNDGSAEDQFRARPEDPERRRMAAEITDDVKRHFRRRNAAARESGVRNPSPNETNPPPPRR